MTAGVKCGRQLLLATENPYQLTDFPLGVRELAFDILEISVGHM
jgi:hypothetical protein